MTQGRRTFLKLAGAAGVVAVAGTAGTAEAAVKQKDGRKDHPRGMAKGLTLLSIRGKDGEPRLAVKTAKGILDVAEAARAHKLDGPATMDELLQQEDGPRLEAIVKAATGGPVAKAAAAKAGAGPFLDEASLTYAPLVSRPEKIVCVGLNYRHHAQEIGAPIPKQPVLFNKYNNSLNAHRGTVKLPTAVARKFDYEVELVIVMGKLAKDVAEADALSYVAGYATGNDFSARDLQLDTGGQWMAGKTSDGFAPLGPHLVTADQVNPDELKLECRVNGETRQSSNTNDLIYGCRQIISYTSRIFTLRPGDVIFTGTPEGVVLGKPKDQQDALWLKPGDKVACSIEKLGELSFSLT
jgi:2-keto-4-pentenoate hydratase/2-oxohepta-3-ene-1,7-dioic acid hydratase in catechol pathway